MSERNFAGSGRDTTAALPVTPSDAELTTHQAAELLNVSRAFVLGLLDAEEIAYRTVGTHRRITASSLTEYKRRDDRRREQAADELIRLGREMESPRPSAARER